MTTREFLTNVAIIMTVMALYDRVPGTYTPSDRAYSVVSGLDDTDPIQSRSFPGLLAMPCGPSTAGARI
jgi:hypothetical protein